MKKLLLLCLLLAPAFARAQYNPVIYGSGAPTNPCSTPTQDYLDTTNHNWYRCNNGTWGLQASTSNTGTGSGVTGATWNTLTGMQSAANYGVVSDTYVSDASVTSGQSIVTCPNSDCHFLTTAAVGNMMQGGTSANGQVLATGTITSVDSDTQVHVSTTASATATATMLFTWGPDNTTALTNAWLATGYKCNFLFLPVGTYFTTTAQFNASNGCTGGGIISSNDWSQTYIMMTYNFSYTTGGPSGSGCNGGTQSACFGGVQNETLAYIIINGAYGGSNPAAAHAIAENQGGYFNYVGVTSICAGCANVRGKAFTGVEPGDFQGAVVNSGQLACLSTGTTVQLYLSPCLGGSGGGGQIGFYMASGTAFSKGSFFTGTLDAVRVVAGSFHEENDSFVNTTNQFSNTGGSHFLKHCSYNNNPIIVASGATTYIQDNDFTTMSSSHLTINSGGTVIDQGGNVMPNSAYVSNSGTYIGLGSQTTTAITAGKLVLSAGWGNTAAWSGLAGFNNVTGTITASGTGQAANPTITYTFPTRYPVAPAFCTAVQTGGNNPLGQFSASALSATGVTFTYSLSPTPSDTIVVAIQCFNN